MTGPILEGKGETGYERYIRVPELLALQKPKETLAHPDERLFQTTHQSAELWLHQIDYEMGRAAECVANDQPQAAAELIERAREILDLLREQIVILETMTPVDYHVIRLASLGRGSGQESAGFQKLLDVGKRLWPPFVDRMRRRSLSVLDLERAPREYADDFRLLQAMMNYDEAFMKWRFTHMRLAFRIIGSKVLSLKGVPAARLEMGTREPLFPELWEAIGALTAGHKPSY